MLIWRESGSLEDEAGVMTGCEVMRWLLIPGMFGIVVGSYKWGQLPRFPSLPLSL